MTSPLESATCSPLLCPSGTLRASINLGNPILANKNAATGEVFGVSVDLSRELAKRLGVALELKVFDAAAKSVAAVTNNEADIGFFAIDPLRGEGIRFTAAYIHIEGYYLVRQHSPLQLNEDVDKTGIRITAAKGSAYDLFLTRHLKHATLVHATTSQAVTDTFLQNSSDVAAGVRQQLESDIERLLGQEKLRLLNTNFMVIAQAMGIPNHRGEAATNYVRHFVEEMKRSGFVAESLKRHGIVGAAVAPSSSASFAPLA
ncbi:MAG: ABC transporter substrate-binding protein [Cytophagales bacterium]|nr:ABC transporter substrate-binding protein [Cytophagales bacterium]